MQVSVVPYKNLDPIAFRIDAEYYRKSLLEIEAALQNKPFILLGDCDIELDCSAFYPAVTQHYNFECKGIPFLRVNEIQNGLVSLTESTAFLPDEILDENSRTITTVAPGDIIIAKGGNTIAKVGLVTDDYAHYGVCRDLIVIRTVNMQLINKYYLWIFLHSKTGQTLMLRRASQTGQPHLTLELFRTVKIPVLNEKMQLVYEGLYKKANGLKDNHDSFYAKATRLLLRALQIPENGLASKSYFIKRFSETPHSWRFDAEYYHPKYDELFSLLQQNAQYCRRIKDFAAFNGRGLQPEYMEDGDLRVINSQHILEQGLDYDGFDRTDSAKWETQKRAQVFSGDILTYTTGANIGRTSTYLEMDKALASNHVNVLRLKEENLVYVGFVMNSLIGRMQTRRMSTGSAQAELYPSDIDQFIIPFVDPATQNEIAQCVLKAHAAKKTARALLDAAKRAVEMAIEEDEPTAEAWLRGEAERLGIEL